MMMVSAKGRYAIRILIELAKNGDGGYLSLKTVAERQSAPIKYLEAIAAILRITTFQLPIKKNLK